MSKNDIFRPHSRPARDIYDAFVAESKMRNTRSADEWQQKERSAVFRASFDLAKKIGGTAPTMCDIMRCEIMAVGHSDYGKKWAYCIADVITNGG